MTESEQITAATLLRQGPSGWRSLIRRRLAWRLGAVVAAMTLALLISAGITLAALLQFRSAVDARAAAQNQARLAFQIHSDVQSYTAALLDMVWTHTDRTADLARHHQQFSADLAAARQQAQPEQLALLDELARQEQAFEALAAEMVGLSQEGRDTEVAIKWIRGKNLAEQTAAQANGYYQAQDAQAAAAQEAAARQSTIATLLLIGTLALALVLGISVTVVLSRRIVDALDTLTGAAQRVANQELVQLPVTSQDERAIFARSFNAMVSDLAGQREALRHWSEELEQSVAERTTELQGALDRQAELSATIRHMSTPVLPVLEGMLVVPLVGVLDDERMAQLQTTLLHAVTQHRADTAILDITGMPIIDEAGARYLIETIQQVRLLGATSLLVGVAPEVAETLVALGIDLSQIQTLTNLQTAVAAAVRQGPAGG